MNIRIAFFGTPDFAVPTLAALHGLSGVEIAAVVTQPDRSAGRGQKVQVSPVKAFALKQSLPTLQPERIKHDISGFMNQLRSAGVVHLGIVVAFGQILPREVLTAPEHGCLNLHASLLPRWRGAAPIQRAIMAGDSESGISLMRMEEGLDSGPVYATWSLPIAAETTFGTLHDQLAAQGADLLVKHLPEILSGRLVPVPQEASLATHAKKIDPQEQSLVWSKPAQELALIIRGLSPVPGAYTRYRSQRLKILRASPKGAIPGALASPGTISAVDAQRLEVCCGADVLSIEEVQLEGKRRMPVDEFLRGHAPRAGTLLGEAA